MKRVLFTCLILPMFSNAVLAQVNPIADVAVHAATIEDVFSAYLAEQVPGAKAKVIRSGEETVELFVALPANNGGKIQSLQYVIGKGRAALYAVHNGQKIDISPLFNTALQAIAPQVPHERCISLPCFAALVSASERDTIFQQALRSFHETYGMDVHRSQRSWYGSLLDLFETQAHAGYTAKGFIGGLLLGGVVYLIFGPAMAAGVSEWAAQFGPSVQNMIVNGASFAIPAASCILPGAVGYIGGSLADLQRRQ